MKVVSLVPSWTEMLIECSINVVGRTRFCLHPGEEVAKIASVGGTKDLNLETLASLQADLLILDQEENLAWMKEKSPIPVHVTHVTSVESVSLEVQKLSEILGNQQLQDMAKRWKRAAGFHRSWSWKQIPGEMEILNKSQVDYEKLVYVIWKNPWMSVSKDTFIGSMLKHLGAEKLMLDFDQKYPEIDLEKMDLEKTFFLFSSEPFPFHKKTAQLKNMNLQGAIVDGESYSWFGSRSLRFLEGFYSSPTY